MKCFKKECNVINSLNLTSQKNKTLQEKYLHNPTLEKMICGGFGECEITPEVQEIADGHLADINSYLGKTFKSVLVTKYKNQVVAGMNHQFEFTADDGIKGSARVKNLCLIILVLLLRVFYE